jgi:MOSC domain-containing protein YiiM
VESAASAVLEPGRGIVGDHYRPKRGGGREVTLIQYEDLAHIAGQLGRETIAPELLRRNLVVSGMEVASLQARTFRIGEVLLEGTGPCNPCSRMEEALGPGGRKAMSRRGGITAVIRRGGTIRVGDRVEARPEGGETTPALSIP